MGISDDIKPKRAYHPREKTSHIPVSTDLYEGDDFDLDLEEHQHNDVHEEKHAIDYKSLENLENDFFDNEKKAERPKESFNNSKPEHEKPRKNLTKTTIVLMTIALLSVLVWQNYSEIKTAAKKFIFKTDDSITIETQKTDEYYTGESTTATETPSTTSNPSATTTPAPVATPAPEINKAAITIEILNGNGIKNSGSAVKTQLVAAGFKVAKTTNAKNFNYATSLIYYKTGKDAEAALVKSSITGKEITLENNDTLAGDYDIVIIIGAK